MTLLALVLVIGATARLTRLITSDAITRHLREGAVRRLVEHEGDPRRWRGELAYLIMCSWCSSVWVGAAVAGTWWAWGGSMWYQAACAALTASHVTGALASATETGD